MALMAFSDAEVSNDKSCLQNYEALKKQYDDLLVKLDDMLFNALHTKEVTREYLMGLLKTELKKVKEEKEGFEFKIAKFEKSSKDLDQLLASQITDKSKKGFGYNAIPSPHHLVLNRPTSLDLSYSGLQEFKQPEVNKYGPRDTSVKPTTSCDKESENSKENIDDSLKQQQKTDSSSIALRKLERIRLLHKSLKIGCQMMRMMLSLSPKVEKKTVIPTVTKKEFVKPETPVRRSVSCPNVHKHMVPRAVLMKTGLKTFNTVRFVNTSRPFSTASSFNTVRPSYTAHPKSIVHCARPRTYFQNQAQSTVQRPFYKKTALTKRSYNQNVNTGRQNVNTVRARGFNASNSQLNDKGFVDSGCSRHMSGNIAHLSDFKDFDGGYVTFGGGANGGRITGKGTIKTDKLDFDDVYFVKELKFNLFSVSQMCDKKNYVLFTDSECLVLSPNFKLPDENQILLKIPRQDNMYSFDMKNIVPKDGLTCLVAKATSEESMLWHSIRRLGIKREYSVARTPQQNGVAKRKNRTLIEAARTMLADSKLPTQNFWDSKSYISTALYWAVDGKSDEVSLLDITLKNKPMIEGNGPKWLFDLDSLTQSMNYVPVVARNFSNDFASIQEVSESSTSSQQDQDNQDCIVMPIWKNASYFGDASPRSVADQNGLHDENDDSEKTHDDSSLQDNGTADQQVNTVRPEINTGSREVSTVVPEVNIATPEDLVGRSPASEDTQVEDQEIEFGNIPPSYAVPTTPHTRIHKDHPIDHVIGDVQSSVQTRRMTTSYSELGFLSAIYEGKTHQDLHTCLFACFLSQEEPKRVSKALSDPTWVEAMQEELL
ncbi:ribonuclease H-like domain-containing protein [Tanacetum coccineum]